MNKSSCEGWGRSSRLIWNGMECEAKDKVGQGFFFSTLAGFFTGFCRCSLIKHRESFPGGDPPFGSKRAQKAAKEPGGQNEQGEGEKSHSLCPCRWMGEGNELLGGYEIDLEFLNKRDYFYGGTYPVKHSQM